MRLPLRKSDISQQDADRAKTHLRQLRYDENTIRCAQGFNTPMWQHAVHEMRERHGALAATATN